MVKENFEAVNVNKYGATEPTEIWIEFISAIESGKRRSGISLYPAGIA
jgi:3-oxoacyl-[acyl-carrier-protein] synthase III